MSTWLQRGIAVGVLTVVLAAVAIGFSTSGTPSNDRDADRDPVLRVTSSPTPSAESDEPTPTASPRATASPAAPAAGATQALAPSIDVPTAAERCAAATVKPGGSIESTLGADDVRAAACAALTFVLDMRYSRLSLPQLTYARSDFTEAASYLTAATRTRTYPERIRAVVADPRGDAARRGTGLLLLNGPDVGAGRVFYGPPWSRDGYADRAVWVDPEWSPLEVAPTGGFGTRVRVDFSASAAIPVWNPSISAGELLRIPTSASLQMLREGSGWKVDSWTLSSGEGDFEPLPRD